MENKKNIELDNKAWERFNYQINTVAKKAIENANAIREVFDKHPIETDEPMANLKLRKRFNDLGFYLHAIELHSRDANNTEFLSDEYDKELDRFGF